MYQQRCIHRKYSRDKKIRYSEIYLRNSNRRDLIISNIDDRTIVLLPTARFLRKYLSLLEHVPFSFLDTHFFSHKERSDYIYDHPGFEFINGDVVGLFTFSLLLLESVVNTMEYRTLYHMVDIQRYESPEFNEFRRVNKLFSSDQQAVSVVPVADMTEFSINEYEWNFNDLDNTEIQSCYSLARLAIDLKNKKENEPKVQILVSDTEECDIFSNVLKTFQQEQLKVNIMDPDQWIKFLTSHSIFPQNRSTKYLPDKKKSWQEIQETCKMDYISLNYPHYSLQKSYGFPCLHVPPSSITYHLAKHIYYRGKLSISNINPMEEGTITVNHGNESRIYNVDGILGWRTNRAFHGDIVVVEPLPKHLWESQHSSNKLIYMNNHSLTLTKKPMPSARIVSIFSPHRRVYVATLPHSGECVTKPQYHLAVPMEKRIPKLRIKVSQTNFDLWYNKRILIEVDGWNIDSFYPHGHVIRVIGDIGLVETEVSCLLLEHKIEFSPFSMNALACLPAETWTVSNKMVENRRDLRHRQVFSVDPCGCQDIDDAMHIHILSSGDIEVGVHIADVTYFIEKGSALDQEISQRATTFYLVDRKFDMLPSLLSSNICSLQGNVDRLAVSVIWTLSSDFTIRDIWYGRTIINNRQAMTYDQADNILNDISPNQLNEVTPPILTAGGYFNPNHIRYLKKDLQKLTELARVLRINREETYGAIDLSCGSSEYKFIFGDNGRPIQVLSKKEKEIHHTVEELMIWANTNVAQTIHEHCPHSSLLRVHRTIEQKRFNELKSLLRTTVDKGVFIHNELQNNRSLAKTLKSAQLSNKISSNVDLLFKSLATKAMSEAEYVCSGIVKEIEISHYGLGIGKYTHFTSPIRRFADCVVHRLLLASLNNGKKRVNDCFQRRTNIQLLSPSIPDSTVMSILHRNAIDNSLEMNIDDSIDALINGATELTLGSWNEREMASSQSSNLSSGDIYKKSEVADLCERLNSQNRAAKLSSIECQRLFLSLTLCSNYEIVPAIIVGLRQNGCVVYVPKFDMKGALFLTNHDGNVTIDPRIFGLSALAGSPPSVGFDSHCRTLIDGECILHEANNDDDTTSQLELRTNGIYHIFRKLDVVTVQLSCDSSKCFARIPPVWFHLVSLTYTEFKDKNSKEHPINYNPVDSSNLGNKGTSLNEHRTLNKNTTSRPSIFQILTDIEFDQFHPKHIALQTNSWKNSYQNHSNQCVQTISGRYIFGSSRNPEALAAINDRNAKKLSLLVHDPRNERSHKIQMEDDYSYNSRVEREVMVRSRKLASEKFESRRANKKT